MDRLKAADPSLAGPAAPVYGELTHPAPLQAGARLLESRFLRALHEPSPSQAPPRLLAQMTSPFAAPAAPPARAGTDLVALLDRVCSAMYVGEERFPGQRVVLALDSALPGAAAEIVREGARLRVRLYARTRAVYRLMSSQRDALVEALGARGKGWGEIEIIQGEGGCAGCLK